MNAERGVPLPQRAEPDGIPCVAGRVVIQVDTRERDGRPELRLRLVCATTCPICMAEHRDRLAGDEQVGVLPWAYWSRTCSIAPRATYFIRLEQADLVEARARRRLVAARARGEGWSVVIAPAHARREVVARALDDRA